MVFHTCVCFFEQNYFLPKYAAHVSYRGENNLSESMKKVLQGCNIPAADFDDALNTLKAERKRRLNLGAESLERKMKIRTEYHPFHSHLYILQESFFHPDFMKLVHYANSQDANRNELIEKLEVCCDHVWRFPVFTHQFCVEFLEELNHFLGTDLPKGRPNTMNNYGILLDELGFEERFLVPFRLKYLSPVARLLLPEWYGNGLDSHKAFTVSYKAAEDRDLAYHFDNAEITLNVCLGKEFENGELYFGEMRTDSSYLSNPKRVDHKVGYGILHRGQHMHGAMPISGDNAERHNIIIWMRSPYIRNQCCPMCNSKPRLVEQSYGGDGFTLDSKAEEKYSVESSCVAL